MVKPSKKRVIKIVEEIELHEDAWPRFEQFIRDVAKAGPQHRKPRKSSAKRKPPQPGGS
jgi:hypothetical protein